MTYVQIGPFDIQEARALSTSHPETLLIWTEAAHLQDAGSMALFLGYGDAGKTGSRCCGFGGQPNLVRYNNVPMVLCTINSGEQLPGIRERLLLHDTSFRAAYVTEEAAGRAVVRGLERLVRELQDPHSSVANYLNQALANAREEVADLPLEKVSPKLLPALQNGLLQPIGRSEKRNSVLSALQGEIEKRVTRIYSIEDAFERLYPPEVLGRNTHIGMALYYFGQSAERFVQPAIEERIRVEQIDEQIVEEELALFRSSLQDSVEKGTFFS